MRMILRILLVAVIFYVGTNPIDAYPCPTVGPDDQVICYVNCEIGGSYTTNIMTQSQCCSYFDSTNRCYGDSWRSSLFCPTYAC